MMCPYCQRNRMVPSYLQAPCRFHTGGPGVTPAGVNPQGASNGGSPAILAIAGGSR